MLYGLVSVGKDLQLQVSERALFGYSTVVQSLGRAQQHSRIHFFQLSLQSTDCDLQATKSVDVCSGAKIIGVFDGKDC